MPPDHDPDDETFVDPDPTTFAGFGGDTDAAAWEAMRSLPDQDSRPLRWDARKGRFVEDTSAPAPRRSGRSVDPGPPPSDRLSVPRVDLDAPGGPRPPAGAAPAVPGSPEATAVMGRPGAAAGPAPAPPRPAPPSAPVVGRGASTPRVAQRTGSSPHPDGARRSGGGAPPPGSRTAGAGRGPRRPRGGSIRRRIIAAVAIFVVVFLVLPLVFAAWQFSRLERVEVGDALSSGGSGTNYLIVGSDSREGIAEDDPNAGAFIGTTVTGQRADTIIVLRVGDGPSRMMSIPRDLWVTDPATGEPGRINSTYASGPANLIRSLRSLGIPVHRYLEIDFVSFAGMVDAVGGITIEVPHPARDEMSGLDIPEAGVVTLDGAQALAYVRSRQYTELVDGNWVTDPTGDLGRVQRQRAFLSALLGSVASTRNPLTMRSVVSALGPGLRVDDEMRFRDALSLVWRMRGASPESVDLPVYGRTTTGGAAVLELSQPEAGQVLATFGDDS